MATSSKNKYTDSRIKQRDRDPINHRVRGNLKTLDISYGGVHGTDYEPTIYMNPLRATPTVLKEDNTRPARREHNLPLQPCIEHTEEARECGSLLLKYYDLQVLDNYPKLKPYAMLMYDRLTFHKSNFQGHFPDPLWMVGKSLLLGPAFTEEWLSDCKIAKFKMMNMKFNIPPDKWPEFSMTDYSSTYLGYHFIFWKESVNDYEAMFGGVPESSPEILSEIEEIVSRMSQELLTDEEIMSDAPDDHVFRPVATGGFDGDDTKPEWLIEYDDPSWDIEEEIMICARSIAPKRPGETRDIGIMKPSSLHFHRRFMWHLQKAITKIDGCPYGKSPEYLRRVVGKIGSKNEYFYMRDYTKSGMTIPHKVQEAVLKGFFRRRPDMGLKAARFFSNQQLYFKQDDGSWLLTRPETGSPLGMFVEGYTILQYALHNLNCAQISAPSKSFQFTATNDDMVVGSVDRDHLEEYLLADERNNSELGMSYKDTKSGISHHKFVYCEEYWNGDELDPKSALFATTLIGAKHCNSIFHAKEYCHAVLLSAGCITPQIVNALHEIQAYWGPEFHDDEFNWPYLFGGWLPQIKEGVDHSIEWFNGDLKAIAGYWANQVRVRKKGKLTDEPHLTIGRKIGLKLIQEPENPSFWLDLVPLFGSKRALEYHYRTGFSHPAGVLKEYLLLSKLRKERYERIMHGLEDAPPVFEGYLSRHPNSYILDNMPGLCVEDPVSRVTTPRIGIKERGFIPELHRMRKLGYVDFDVPASVSQTSVMLAEEGISSPFNYTYLPVGPSGVSKRILQIFHKNYINFYERTGKCIVSVDDDDAPFEESRLWPYMTHASLLTVCRMYSYMNKKLRRRLTVDDLVRAGEAHTQISIQHSRGFAEEEDSEDEEHQPISEAALLIGEMVRDVIRDWVPNPDEIIDSMRDRIICRNERLKSDEVAMRLANLTSESVSLLPENVRADGELCQDNDGESESSASVYDPWGELGI